MKVPKTVRFDAQVLNEKDTGGIANYWWKTEKLGIPFVSNDMIINQQEGKSISYTFMDSGRYRVTVQVKNNLEEISSASITLFCVK